MALRILNAGPGPEEVIARIREAIQAELPGAVVRVESASAGHFQLAVESDAFAGMPKVKQHQRVYSAIAHLMSGDTPPVHAIDRLDCEVP